MSMSITTSKDTSWWVFALPAILGTSTSSTTVLLLSVLATFTITFLLTWAVTHGGLAWKNNRARLGRVPIPGPRGLPVFGSLFTLTQSVPHRALASISNALNAKQLMAFSIGNTPAVVSSDPVIAREILTHPSFADRPLKRSARELMFGRAIGFAPNGVYWRFLRGISASHLFAPRRIAAHEPARQEESDVMVGAIMAEQVRNGSVVLRPHLQGAALNNIMGSVFGKRYDVYDGIDEALKLKDLVREGFELLGAFNWSDHLPWLSSFYDPNNVIKRSAALVPQVREFVKGIIDEHREKNRSSSGALTDTADFVDVLLSLEGESKLDENDMIAVLWEMIFRGTDTTALLTEWAMAELTLHPTVQAKLRAELDTIDGPITDADVAKLPYLQAVVKETLRAHPPGPLLSWARLSTAPVQLSNGMVVPTQTTAMVNMWSITHDPSVWADPEKFIPERFVAAEGGEEVDVRGNDLRLAPFGAGRRVCPGKNLGLVTVGLWVAKLVKEFEWGQADGAPVDLSEVLKLSCEMKLPLTAVAVARNVSA